ncbi:MAG: TonB-dependent receptor, partial [Flavobacteriaceae bacterium]|nr:TonB-dependent receptor [Flavobacteriaceae bacterium]
MKNQITLIACFLSMLSQAQEIKGTLQSDSGEPIAFATILLQQPSDSALVKSTISNEGGIFSLKNIKPGEYLLSISNVGMLPYRQRISHGNTPLDLGTIILEEAVEELQEVTVTGEKPLIEVQADRTVFNVENTINATGTSAFELLRKAPGVIIDNNGGIIVEGKSGVQFFINNRPSILRGEDLISYLLSLQATDIEAVEIITQPSSKYDAAGNAGIINIILKKDKSLGTNGTATAGVTVGDFGRYNSSVTFNTRGKKGNLYGTYSNGFGKNTSFINLLRTQSGTQFDARTSSIIDRNANNLKLGYDLYASGKSTLGVLLNGNFINIYRERYSRTPIYPVGQTSFDSVLVANSINKFKSYNLDANLNYRYADTLGYELNIDLDYGRYGSERTTFLPNRYFNGDETEVISENITFQDTPIDIDIATVRLDYEQPFLKGVLAAGFKLSLVTTSNVFDFYNRENGQDLLDTDRSNTFDYEENINAAYLNYNYKKNKWNLQMGVRMENTVSDGRLTTLTGTGDDRVERNYTNFFPSGGLTYQASPKSQWALTYSKRIERPNYQSLNPFEYPLDELSFSKGNPFLQPQYADNLKLSHTHNYRLTTSLGYTYISDFFARVTVASDDGRNFLTTLNVADQEIINLGVSYPKKIREWWNLYLSVNAYSSNYKANSPEFLPVKQETLSLYAQNTFTLSPS